MRNLIQLLLIISVATLRAQEFLEFEALSYKADSSYKIQEYSLHNQLLMQAIQLPQNKRPVDVSDEYYNLACGYSLVNDREKSIYYLVQSYRMANLHLHKNPVTFSHLATDADLDNVRYQPEFSALLKKYYGNVPRGFFVDKITYSELLDLVRFMHEKASPSDMFSKYSIKVRGKTIYWNEVGDGLEYNTRSLPYPNLECLKLKILEFENCTFELNLFWYSLGQETPQAFPYQQFKFTKCYFNGLIFIDGMNFVNPTQFRNTRFSENIWLSCNFIQTHDDEWYGFLMDSCSVKGAHIQLTAENPTSLWLTNNSQSDSSDISLHCNKMYSARIYDNNFSNKDVEFNFGETEMLRFQNNKLKNLIIHHTNVKSEFDFQETTLKGKLMLDRTFFTDDPQNDVDWNNLTNWRVSSLKELDLPISLVTTDGRKRSEKLKFKYLSGELAEDISNPQSFRELMGLYSMFLNLYKNKNDIESYNGCYVEIKELQSRRLKYLYESNASFETYFRWKLSRLLKFYVRHGTDPARAIVISINIIVIFGVFFFFFPSDWDVTSKGKLIQNFKDLIQKNEKGYIKPFFILLSGFLISLLNALTLSLNAFITLGFGNIPTHGLARYICVLEGFLGWFLLSIFTVALINQVL